jgi:hypothetical protein
LTLTKQCLFTPIHFKAVSKTPQNISTDYDDTVLDLSTSSGQVEHKKLSVLREWQRCIDTAKELPDDFLINYNAMKIEGDIHLEFKDFKAALGVYKRLKRYCDDKKGIGRRLCAMGRWGMYMRCRTNITRRSNITISSLNSHGNKGKRSTSYKRVTRWALHITMRGILRRHVISMIE